jgi:hypothetical protein
MYRLCEWDHERQRWDTILAAPSIFALRKALRAWRKDWADYNLLIRRGRCPVGTRRRQKMMRLK